MGNEDSNDSTILKIIYRMTLFVSGTLPDLDLLVWEYHAQVSSHVYGASSFNLMFHGWLFAKEVRKDHGMLLFLASVERSLC